MPTVLNNTQRNFDSFSAPVNPGGPLVRITVKPGFNTLNDGQLKQMKNDSHFMRALAQDAIIIHGNETDTREVEFKPLEKVPESPEKKLEEKGQAVDLKFEKIKVKKRGRKAKKADADFKDFE